MVMNSETKLRKFHGAAWDEQLIYEQSVPGERGILVPQAEKELASLPGSEVLGTYKRAVAPNLPEMNQMKVNRHYMRLSQMIQGAVDLSINISEGTCTMKYSPKVQEHMARVPQISEVHPLQDPATMQGILKIYYETEQYIKAISGLDAFSFQFGGGGQAIYTAGSIMRAYHREHGNINKDEIITTIFSHPVDGATPKANGFKVITLLPDKEGYPDLEALKGAVSERTAGLFITNPEDTGLYNSRIAQYVETVHAVGGLCFYDQANANGMLGIARAREAGFDMCHFNLHKTFSAPHGSYGPAAGALGCRDFLAKYLPVPRVSFDGAQYYLDHGSPESIGRVRSFLGNAGVILRAYMWIRQHGPEGLREAAIISVLNNNYLQQAVESIPGTTRYYGEGKRRLEQVRYSWEQLKKDTGYGTDDINARILDFGIPDYFPSHSPYIVPEPMTLEPCESYSKEDLDEYIAVLREAAREAYEEPKLYAQQPPFNTSSHAAVPVSGPAANATTWRIYKKYQADIK